MPSRDYSRLSMARDEQTRPAKVPSTKTGLAKWLEEYHAKLEMDGNETWCCSRTNKDSHGVEQCRGK
eukprot:6861795-Prorocentrum_lima.AAC.1